jgi:hypothetical protein
MHAWYCHVCVDSVSRGAAQIGCQECQRNTARRPTQGGDRRSHALAFSLQAGGCDSERSESRLYVCTFEQAFGLVVRALSQGGIVVYAGYQPLQGAALGCMLSQQSGMPCAELMSQQDGVHIVSAGC